MARREEVVSSFNEMFKNFIKTMAIDEAYKTAVFECNYRTLNGFNSQGEANRSARVAVNPSESEVKVFFFILQNII